MRPHFSNRWKRALLLLPILGTSAIAADPRAFDTALARNWLVAQVPGLVATTSTPPRVLAATAQALPAAQPERARLLERLRAAAGTNGCWTTPGAASAAEDQTFALLALPEASAACGFQQLLATQRPEGGWSPTLGRYDYPDAVSTALALLALETSTNAAARAARQKASTFLMRLRDPVNGSFGYENSGLGSWGSSVASTLALGDRSIATNLLAHTLKDPDLLRRGARRPLVEAWLFARFCVATGAGRDAPGAAELLGEIAARQKPDGSVPPPRAQREEGPVYATALALLTVETFTATATATAP